MNNAEIYKELEDLLDQLQATEKPITAKNIEEAFGKVDFEKLIGDDILKKSEEELLMPASYGSSFADTERTLFGRKSHKKIKRRLFYEVIWWGAERRYTKCFYSVNKMRKFVNELHLWYNDYIEIEKTWCYREFTPRHKWYYVSYYPNQFVCVEKY